ncbi:MAG TPA: hypothetical protein PLS28_02410, partial [Clostridiales bacterium]|nr:hypothetical protein [Clostridiales bacterium]
MKKEKGNRKKRNIFLLVLEGVFFLLFLVAAVQRPKIGAGAVVGAHRVLRAKRRPGRGTEHVRLFDVVHADG